MQNNLTDAQLNDAVGKAAPELAKILGVTEEMAYALVSDLCLVPDFAALRIAIQGVELASGPQGWAVFTCQSRPMAWGGSTGRFPNPPYKNFDTEKEALDYIDSRAKGAQERARGLLALEDPVIARWTLEDALANLDPDFDGIGQAFLDYISQRLGAGLQPTKGGLSSIACDNVRSYLQQAGEIYFARNPKLGFCDTVRSFSILATRGGSSLNPAPGFFDLLTGCREAVTWISK